MPYSSGQKALLIILRRIGSAPLSRAFVCGLIA